ncbi:MAG: TIGR02147 family protein [Oligoflexia bacterium]|nr:TIGR02147 family protein [Oligoflexia bacterium]
MGQSVFGFRGYREFLEQHLGKSAPRGQRQRLAKFLKCQPAYVSRVMKGKAELSLEQAEATTRFLRLSEPESRFFLLLVLHDRAGTPGLRARFKDEIEKELNSRSSIKNRMRSPELSPEVSRRYYASWLPSLLHVAASVPELRTVERLSSRFRLDPSAAASTLEFLEDAGLIEHGRNGYRITNRSIHLGGDSALVTQHHSNWRLRCLESLNRERRNDLHYSSVISCSYRDKERIRELMLNCIAEIRAIVRESPEEEVFAYLFDLFEMS